MALKYLLIASALTAGAASAPTTADEPENRFQAYDTDGDGRVGRDEMLAKARERFTALDSNGDQRITYPELPQLLPLTDDQENRLESRAARIEKRAERRGKDIDSEAVVDRLRPTRAKFMARHDKDGDEAVTFEEFTARLTRLFARVDRNNDAFIDQQEAQAARKWMKNRLRKRGRAPRG